MSEPIVFMDTWRVREGKFDEFRAAAREFVEFVSEHEPQLVAYKVYADEEGHRATVFQIHPDSESIEFHMRVAGPRFGRFLELYEPGGRIEIHGRPADDVLKRIRQTAKQFGVTVAVREPCAGFARFPRGDGSAANREAAWAAEAAPDAGRSAGQTV